MRTPWINVILILILFVLLSGMLFPARGLFNIQESWSWMCQSCAAHKSQTDQLFQASITKIQKTDLTKWLEQQDGVHTHVWRRLHHATSGFPFGGGISCAQAPPISEIKEDLSRVIERLSEAELIGLTSALETSSRKGQMLAIRDVKTLIESSNLVPVDIEDRTTVSP